MGLDALYVRHTFNTLFRIKSETGIPIARAVRFIRAMSASLNLAPKIGQPERQRLTIASYFSRPCYIRGLIGHMTGRVYP